MSQCIETPAGRNQDGYGVLMVRGVDWLAHRLAWTQANGPIPDGLHVLHHCDNPPCINVDHLFLGTNRDNIRDRHEKGRDAKGPTHGWAQHPERIPHAANARHNLGERNGRARLTGAQVVEIRRLVAAGEKRYLVARRYGLGWTTVNQIVKRERWAHVA